MNISITGKIENGTTSMVLDVVNTEGAHFEVKSSGKTEKSDSDNSQMWKQSNYLRNDKSFFTLTNKMTAKVLTAVAPNSLTIEGMYLKLFRI